MNSTTIAPTVAAMKPAPWSARYQPTAWPMKVATNAPAMPSAVVRRKPAGLLGPGASSRAMTPATKPTNTIHRIPMICLWLDPVVGASNDPVHFVGCRQATLGGENIDRLGQLFAEAGQQLLARQSRARHQEVDLFGRQDLAEVGRCDGLILAGADPGLGDVFLARTLELLEQVAQPACQEPAEAARSGTHAVSSAEALEEIAQPA